MRLRVVILLIVVAVFAPGIGFGQSDATAGKAGDRSVTKNADGTTRHVTVRTADGYQVKDASGRLLYRVVENDREKRVYDATGRLISRESKPVKK